MQEQRKKNLLFFLLNTYWPENLTFLLTYLRTYLNRDPQGIFYLRLFEKKLIFSKMNMSKKPVTSFETLSGIVDLYKLLNK